MSVGARARGGEPVRAAYSQQFWGMLVGCSKSHFFTSSHIMVGGQSKSPAIVISGPIVLASLQIIEDHDSTHHPLWQMLDGWFLVLGIQALSLFPPAVVVATRAALLLGIRACTKISRRSSPRARGVP